MIRFHSLGSSRQGAVCVGCSGFRGAASRGRRGGTPAPDARTDAAAGAAQSCLTDIRAFSDQMRKDGYWLGGSTYGYGYPLDGYGYGYSMGGYPPGNTNLYQNARRVTRVRNLIASANILGQAVSSRLRGGARHDERHLQAICGRSAQPGRIDARWPGLQRQQIAAALPVADKRWLFDPISCSTPTCAIPRTRVSAASTISSWIRKPAQDRLSDRCPRRSLRVRPEIRPDPLERFQITQNASPLVLDAGEDRHGRPLSGVGDDQFSAAGHFDQRVRR